MAYNYARVFNITRNPIKTKDGEILPKQTGLLPRSVAMRKKEKRELTILEFVDLSAGGPKPPPKTTPNKRTPRGGGYETKG